MFFTCPKCNTVYDVPAEQVDTARQLRCAMCGHLWEPAAETEDVEEEKDETEHSFPTDGDEADDLPVFPDADADPFANESDLTAFKPIFQTPEEQPAEKRWLRPLYFSSMVFIAIGIYAFFFHLPNKTPLEFRSLSPEYVEKDYQTTLILNAVVSVVFLSALNSGSADTSTSLTPVAHASCGIMVHTSSSESRSATNFDFLCCCLNSFLLP